MQKIVQASCKQKLLCYNLNTILREKKNEQFTRLHQFDAYACPHPRFYRGKGKVHFGTFDAPFKNLNLLDAVKPCGNKMPDFMKPSRLVEWEAFEVHMDEGALISAVYSTGPMGFSIFVWYDKRKTKFTVGEISSPRKRRTWHLNS